MKTNTTTVLSRWMHLLGAILTLALMVPADASSQTNINLQTASSFAVLAAAGITNSSWTGVIGDIGSYPDATMIGLTGHPPELTLTGTNHWGDLTTQAAMVDLHSAYLNAAGQPGTNDIITELGGKNLTTGVYYNSSEGKFAITTGDLTLDGGGNNNAVFIFQMTSTLSIDPSRKIILSNGAKWSNIFWQVGSSATLGASSVFHGTILANTSITAGSCATVYGRLLAGAGAWTGTAWTGDLTGAVTLDGDTIIRPAIVNIFENGSAPQAFTLLQNYPNPFNPSTTFSFNLSKKSFVALKVFDLLGREVATIVSELLPAGNYSRQWNAANISSGVYFYKISFGSFSSVKKMLLLR